jgi:UPF0271 protein
VSVGAHPGYFDREHFGRREFPIDNLLVQGTYDSCDFQIGALVAYAKRFKVKVKYVKPHGALYNQACRDHVMTASIVVACRRHGLPLVGLQGSAMAKFARGPGIRHPFIPEGFADRRYQTDGTLVPRSDADAVLHDVGEVVRQVRWLVGKKRVRTICVHGDTPGAVEFVRAVRGALLDAGHELKAFA